jgi:hypothetical protein
MTLAAMVDSFISFFHASSKIFASPNASEPTLPFFPTSLDSFDDVDDVTHANKKSCVSKPTDVALPPNKLEEFFKKLVTDCPGYKWQAENLSKDEQMLLYFHILFGHAGLRQICRIIKGKLGSGLPDHLPAGQIHCPVCAISKSTRINPLASTNRAMESLDILAVDLIGPFHVDSVDGGKYIMTMRDVAMGYCFVCVLAHKQEATRHIISIIDKVETSTEKKVKPLCSDNGGEFVNNKLATYLDKKGIIAEQALPYHHYQNGVIEQFNFTAAAMVWTILFDSTLPKSFWSYTFIWAAHTLN